MAKFDEIRKIMREFKQDIDGLANRKIEEMDTAKARLNPTALQEELVSLNIEYKQHFDFTRNMYREKLADAVADRRKGNANKYITGYIDYDLLNKMNIISQSGVELTEPELADFCKAAMKSRSEFCVRKCQLLAKENHYKLNVPSEAKANSVLDEVAKIAGEVIGGYTGALTGRDRGDGSKIMSRACDGLRTQAYFDALKQLDSLSEGVPDKTDHSQPLASEIITDLKAKLQTAEKDRDTFYNQKAVLIMQQDIINFALHITDLELLKQVYRNAKAAYKRQEQEENNEL